MHAASASHLGGSIALNLRFGILASVVVAGLGGIRSLSQELPGFRAGNVGIFSPPGLLDHEGHQQRVTHFGLLGVTGEINKRAHFLDSP